MVTSASWAQSIGLLLRRRNNRYVSGRMCSGAYMVLMTEHCLSSLFGLSRLDISQDGID